MHINVPIMLKFIIYIYIYIAKFTIYKGKAIPCTGLDRPRGFQEAEVPTLQGNQHMKVERLSALRTGLLYPPRNRPPLLSQEIFLVHISVKVLSRPQGHSAARRIISMKNSSDTVVN